MFRKDRFLIGILASIVILAVATTVVVLSRTGVEEYSEGTDPAAIVHNYVLALQRGDDELAYSYMADQPDRPSYLVFRRYARDFHNYPRNFSIRLGETRIDGEEAEVEITVVYASSGPFMVDQTSERTDLALLILQDGNWRLIQMPYDVWNYDWYLSQSKQEPPAPLH